MFSHFHKSHSLVAVLTGLAAFVSVSVGGCTGAVSAPPQPVEVITLAPTHPAPSTSTPSPSAAATIPYPTYTPIPSETPLTPTVLPGFGYGPVAFPQDINPLTGLKVADTQLLERRPMAIKISNFPRSVRPQWGLNLADHIYEYYLERELTRFIGVFYGQDASQVGPVRSARPFDMHVTRMYKAIFAFGFADYRMYSMLMNSDLRNQLVLERPDNCPPLCRIGEDKDYNNLFADTAKLSQWITERGTSNGRQILDGLRFEGNTLITNGGAEANQVIVRFSNESYLKWEYDPSSQRYLRYQDTQRQPPGQETYAPLFDSLDGQQVAADNLIILFVHTDNLLKSHSTEVYDIKLEGVGDALALRNGKIFKIVWKRPVYEALISLSFPSDAPFPLKPGNVWFEVLGETSYFERGEGGVWKFTLSFP